MSDTEKLTFLQRPLEFTRDEHGGLEAKQELAKELGRETGLMNAAGLK